MAIGNGMKVRIDPKAISDMTTQFKKTISDLQKVADNNYIDIKVNLNQVNSAFQESQNNIKNSVKKTNDTIREQQVLFQKTFNGFDPSKNALNDGMKIIGYSTTETSNGIKKFTQNLNDGKNNIITYSGNISKTGDSVEVLGKKVSQATRDNINWTGQLGIAIQRTLTWAGAMTAVYKVIEKVGEGISFISKINAQQTNVKMVTGMNNEDVQTYTQNLSKMGEKLSETTTNLMDSSETWLRAGQNMKGAMKMSEVTTVASKLSGQDQAKQAEQLVSIMNGFDKSADEMMGVVDKIASVDSASSTSFAEIAEALRRVSSGSQDAGVKMETLISWISAVSSESRRSASTIGQAFSSIFARLQSLKQGQLGQDGESISDVEKALNSVGIALRKNKDEWRDAEDVINDVMKNASKWTDLQRNAVYQAISGREQREVFSTLVRSQNEVLKLNEVQLNSTGSSLKKYEEYQESTAGKMAKLKNAQEQLWLSLIDSKTINTAISGLTTVVKTFDELLNHSKLLGATLAGLVVTFVNVAFNLNLVGKAMGALKLISISTMATLATNPLTWIAVAIAGVIALTTKFRKQGEEVEKLTGQYNDLKKAVEENNVEQMKSGVSSLEQQQNDLKDLLEKRKQLSEKRQGLDFEYDKSAYRSVTSELNKVDDKIKIITTSLKNAGLEFNETSGEIYKFSEAQLLIKNNNIVESIRKSAEAEYNHKQEIIGLIQEYQKLSSVEGANSVQKQRMSQIAQQLQGTIQGLTVARDQEGNFIIQNTDLLGKEITILQAEGETAQTLTNVKLASAKQEAEIEVGKTRMTYTEVMKRIKFYEQEMRALDGLKSSTGATMDELIAKEKNGTITAGEQAMLNNMGRYAVSAGVRASSNLGALRSAMDTLDKIYSVGSSGINVKTPSESSKGYFPVDKEKVKKDTEDMAKKAEEAREKAYQTIEDIDKKLVDAIKKQVDKEKKALDERLKNYQDFINEKLKALDNEFSQEDRQRKLAEEKRKKEELLAQQNSLIGDSSFEANAMRYDIQKQIDAQQEVIDGLNRDYSREDRKANLQNQLDLYQKQIEASKKALEDKYSDAEVEKLAKNGLISGLVTVGNSAISVKQLLLDAMKESGEAFSATGQKLQNELLNKLILAQQLLKNMDGSGNIGGNTALKIMGSYADGGLSTRQGLNMLHGTESVPELIMNGGQYKQLAENIWKLATRPIETPKINSNIGARNNPVSVSFDNLINVQGNVDNSTMPKIEVLADKVIRKLEDRICNINGIALT